MEIPVTSGSNVDKGVTLTSANTTSVSKEYQMILLQTAHAIAHAVPVRVLFDNGSQLSYVTETLQRQLGLTPMKIENLHLNTLGHKSYKTQAVVSLYLQDLQQAEATRT